MHYSGAIHLKMPTPNFNFRLPEQKAAALRDMAKLFGSPSTSEFLRVMVGAMCSGDAQQVAAFNGQLFQKIGEQMTLQLVSTGVRVMAEEPKTKGKRRRKGGKVRARP